MRRERGYGIGVSEPRQQPGPGAERGDRGPAAGAVLRGDPVPPAGTALVAAIAFGGLALLAARPGSPLAPLDTITSDELHELALRHPALVTALLAVSGIFSPGVFRVLGLGATLVVARRAPRLAVWAVVTLAGEGLLDTSLKLLVGRDRPVFAAPVATAGGYAYPSGHAFGSVVGVGVLLAIALPRLLRAGRPYVAGAAGVAAAIVLATGFSRVGLGVHWVTDVLAGWIAGVGWLAATVAVARRFPRRA